MAVALRGRTAEHVEGLSLARAYMGLTRSLARAAVRGDEVAMRHLLAERGRLLDGIDGFSVTPARALASEVRALEAQTMVALGADPLPERRHPAAVRRGAAT